MLTQDQLRQLRHINRDAYQYDFTEGAPDVYRHRAFLVELVDDLRADLADSVPKNWYGLMQILDDIYPEETFPTLPDSEVRDSGPRLVSLLRVNDDLKARIQTAHDALDGNIPEEIEP